MQPASSTSPQEQLVFDHTSAHGPTVTHIKGILVANSMENLKELGMYERYVQELPEAARETLLSTLASSWIDMETAMAHYGTACRLSDPGNEQALAELVGKRVGAQVARTLMGVTLRTAGSAGLDALGFVLRRNDRVWDRMYQGGGTRLVQLGPKHMRLEDFGNPLFSFKLFRTGYLAYWRAIAKLCCRGFSIEKATASRPGDDRIATSFKWR